MKKQEGAPALLVCPHCGRRRFKSQRGLNSHISQVHDGDPKVSTLSILSLALGAARAEELCSALGSPYTL